MPVGDIYRVACVGKLFGQTLVNTFHYRLSAGTETTKDTSDDLANTAAGFLLPLFTPVQSTLFSWVNVEAQMIYPLPVAVRSDNPVAIPGTASGGCLPVTTALVCKRISALAGRRYRGRFYLGGIGQTFYNATTGIFIPGADLAAAASAGGLTLFNTLTGNEWAPVLWGKVIHLEQNIYYTTYDTIPRVQRRREVGVGI